MPIYYTYTYTCIYTYTVVLSFFYLVCNYSKHKKNHFLEKLSQSGLRSLKDQKFYIILEVRSCFSVLSTQKHTWRCNVKKLYAIFMRKLIQYSFFKVEGSKWLLLKSVCIIRKGNIKTFSIFCITTVLKDFFL